VTSDTNLIFIELVSDFPGPGLQRQYLSETAGLAAWMVVALLMNTLKSSAFSGHGVVCLPSSRSRGVPGKLSLINALMDRFGLWWFVWSPLAGVKRASAGLRLPVRI